jgi:predicted lipase
MDKKRLLELLELSALAYENEQPLIKDGKVITINDRTTDIQCYIRIEGTKRIVVAFRGSDSKKDWDTDLKFAQMKIPYDNTNDKIRVHGGFVEAYNSEYVRGALHRLLTLNPSVHDVYITGHSYGAALSVLCAVDLHYNFKDKNYNVALFGCPRVGNREFMLSYNRRVFKTLRVENGNDAVTKIPFPIMGFRHVGSRIHIGKIRLPLVFSVFEHGINDYYRALWKKYTP